MMNDVLIRFSQFGRLLWAVVLASVMVGSTVRADDKADARLVADSLDASMTGEIGTATQFDSLSTLNDYLTVAMKRNPGLRSAYNDWVADLKKSDVVGSLPNPTLSYGYYIENVETRVGPQEQRFSLRQSFPWFGSLGAKQDAAFAMSQASFRKFEAARLKLFFEVKAAFYDYYYLGQEIQVTRENLDLLTFWESVARTKYKVGLKQHPDVIKAQVELGKLEDHLRTLTEKKLPTEQRLRALLNLPSNVSLPIPSTIDVREQELQQDSVVQRIVDNNPNLQALQHVVESAQAQERYAGKQSLPDFSIGVEYIQTGNALDPTMKDSGKDPWIVSASVSLPIWFGKNKARRDEAKARQRSAEYNLQDSENRVEATARQVLFEYNDALRKLRLYRDGLVPKAEQSLNASYAAYQSGESDFLDVLDAQRQLLDFQLTVASQQVRLATKRAQLEMLSGIELEEYK